MLYSIAQETIQILNIGCIQPIIDDGGLNVTKRCVLLFLVCMLGEIPSAMLAQDAKGAELSDEDASGLIEYLAKTYGPKQ